MTETKSRAILVVTDGPADAVDRSGTNQPEARQREVLSELSKSINNKDDNSITTTNEECVVVLCEAETSLSTEKAMAMLSRVHEMPFLDFLFTSYEEWRESGADPDFSANGSETGPMSWLIPYHFQPRGMKPHLHARGRACTNVFTRIAEYAMDAFTPIGPHTREAIIADTHLVDVAVREICKLYGTGSDESKPSDSATIPTKSGTRDASDSRVVYCLTVNPGHHAFPASYGGYCFVNYGCVAGQLLLDNGLARIAHLDIDYHSGNGSAAIWYDEPRAHFTSLHIDPQYDYPYAYLPTNDTTIEYALPPRTSWQSGYEEALNSALESIAAFQPAVLIVSCGTDTLAGDPDPSPRGGFQLDVSDFTSIGTCIRTALGDDIVVLVMQEGGYQIDKCPTAISNLLRALAK